MKRTEDKLFKFLISRSKLEVPDPDFEERVMKHVLAEEALRLRRQPLPRELKWSWVLVTLVVLLGITISALLGRVDSISYGIPMHMVKTVFEFVFIVFVLMQVDTLLRLTYRRNDVNLRNQLRET